MRDIINQIAEAIEAEIHEAWTESDADFIRGMEYAISIVRALDIRTDSDLISRQNAIAEFRDGRDVYDIMESIEEVPSADAVEVVRCKDCKHWFPHTQCGYDEDNDEYHDYCGLLIPDDDYYAYIRKPDDYCSYGERKGGEEE